MVNLCHSGTKDFVEQCEIIHLNIYIWTRPATTCDSHLKKNLSKAITAKLYPAKECEKKLKEECIKNKHLSNYIYSMANL